MSLDQLKNTAKELARRYYKTVEFQKFSGELTDEEINKRIDMLLLGAKRTNLLKDIKSMSKHLVLEG